MKSIIFFVYLATEIYHTNNLFESITQILFEISANHSMKDFLFLTIYWVRLLSRSQVGEDK